MAADPLPLTIGDFDVTHSHWWWRDGWGPGTRYLTWHLTFEDAPELHVATEDARGGLGGLSHVDPIPSQWLHMTMTGVGFITDHDEATVSAHADDVLAVAADLHVAPITFDRLYLSSEGVSLVSDTAWLHELKALQVAAVDAIDGPVPGTDERFVPHVSLAYFSGEMPRDKVVDAARAAGLQKVVVRRPRMSLLELGRDDQMYTWRVVAQSRLSGLEH